MTTKPSSVGLDRGIYSSPFDAFTNYMNILGDFINRVNSLYPPEIDNDQLNSLLTTIKNEGDEIAMKDKEIARLQAKLEKLEAANEKLRENEEKPKTKPAHNTRKNASKKETAKKETENAAKTTTPDTREKK